MTPGRRWPRVILGACAIALGAALTLKPFGSLGALTIYVAASLVVAGAGELASNRGRADRILGALLIAAGVLALALPGLTVAGVALAAGVGMVAFGVARVAAGVRGRADERFASITGGAASAILGVLALAWPDLTILTVALLVGPLAVVLGVAQIVRALRGSRRRTSGRRLLRAIRASAALLVALLLAGVSAFLHGGTATVDAFYDASGLRLPSRPGELLRSETFTRAVPAGARAERILFTTTGLDGDVETASGLVVTPKDARGPLPVVLWTHGTTGVARQCAPSVLAEPFTAGAMFVLDEILARGWAFVAPDYPGLGTAGPHPYLVGVPEARSALDAVRAARRLDGVELGDQTVVWGHSQGGGAALWAGIEARAYAPDVPLSGVAALAPASDMPALARSMLESPAGMLFATFVVRGYSDAYPDVKFDDYVRPTAREVVRRVVGRCLSQRATLASIGAVLSGERLFTGDPTSGPLGARLEENVPSAPTGVPTLIAQGLSDGLILPTVQRDFVARLCAAGQPVDYRTFPGRDHVALVAADSPLIPQLVRWTQARLEGERTSRACDS